MLALVAGLAPLAVAIVAVIVLNAAFAFLQELQAERATEALREFLPARATVRRDAQAVTVDARELVPGDVLLLVGGRPPVGRRAADRGVLGLDMSPLTGESMPVPRSAVRSRPSPSPLDSDDLVFAGTLCTGGEAVGVVFATGMGPSSVASRRCRSACVRRSARSSCRSIAQRG